MEGGSHISEIKVGQVCVCCIRGGDHFYLVFTITHTENQRAVEDEGTEGTSAFKKRTRKLGCHHVTC